MRYGKALQHLLPGGIFANVAFLAINRNPAFQSEEMAPESLLWMFPDLNANERIRLQTVVSQLLVREVSGRRFEYDRTVRWAVMFWDML